MKEVSSFGQYISDRLGKEVSSLGKELSTAPMPTVEAAPPSDLDLLTDEIWEALCNAQDMDTSMMDFAKAVVHDVPLVNAAPDLLAACHWAERALAPFSKEPAEKSGIALIRAAITKATAATANEGA